MSLPIQTGFNGGKFGRRMKGRTDLKRYAFGCEELQNFIPTVQGSAVKRSGTRFVKHTTSPSAKSRLFPFSFSNVQSYILEVSVGTIRFYRNSAAILETAQAMTLAPTAANPVVLTIPGHGYSNGDSIQVTDSSMSELVGRFFTVANTTADDFELLGEDGTGRTTGPAGLVARHYGITDGVASNSVPWGAGDLDAIQFVQNGDLLYFAHPSYPPHEIVRSADTSWTSAALVPFFPPLETENADRTVTMSIDDPSIGTRTLTATGRLFTADDIGRTLSMSEGLGQFTGQGGWIDGVDLTKVVGGEYIQTGTSVYYEGRVYRYVSGGTTAGRNPPSHESGDASDGDVTHRFVNWGTGYGTITAIGGGGTTATIDVVLEFPSSVATTLTVPGAASHRWAFGAWDEINGYPGAVAFYEDRLWFGGTVSEPQTVWGSSSGEYDNFRITPADFDDTGVQFSLLSDTLNTIQWLQGGDTLLAGTAGGEFSIDAGAATSAITPSTIRVRRRSSYGSKVNLQPKSLDSVLVFVRQNADLHKLTFSFDSDRYIAPDLTQFAHNILRPGAIAVDYQADPFRQVWVVKSNGALAAMTFDEQEDVIAWADFVLGGTDAAVESLAVIPHPDGDEGQVWLSVRRTVGGSTTRHIEILQKHYEEEDAIEDAFFVECGLTYDGVAATTITGLWHLEGEEVVILADGARVPNQTVTLGTVTLATAASVVHVGLPMGSAKIRTLPWNTSSSTVSTASSQGWVGRVLNVVIQVDLCGEGLEFGANFDRMDTWSLRTPTDPMDAPIPPYTGFSPVFPVPSDWGQTRQIALRHDEPLPCTIVALSAQTETGTP